MDERNCSATPEQIAWAAGLFEGEGCLHVRGELNKRGNMVQMRLGMTDLDVVERFAAIMGCGSIREIHDRWMRTDPRRQPKKRFYEWYLYRASDIVPVLEKLLPHFGVRRAERARAVLERARLTVPRGERTHCPQGHPYAGDNLMLEPITRDGRQYKARRCRTCRKAQEKRKYAVKKKNREALHG